MNKVSSFLALTFLVNSSSLFAADYDLTEMGGFYFVSDNNIVVNLQDDSNGEQSECLELKTLIQRSAANIERCIPGGPQPTSACNLLKGSLTKAIFGDIDSNPATDGADFVLALKKFQLNLPPHKDIAEQNGIDANRIIVGEPSDWSKAIRRIELDSEIKDPIFENVTKLDYFAGHVGVATLTTDRRILIRDRLTYCEALAGNMSLKGQMTYSVEAHVELSAQAQQWLVNLAGKLSKVVFQENLTKEQKAMVWGYEIGRFASDNAIDQKDRVSTLDVVTKLFDKTPNGLELKKLNPADISKLFQSTAKVELNSNFETKISK